MKLYRYTLAYFGKALDGDWDSKGSEVGDIKVTIGPRQSFDNNQDVRLITASIDLKKLPDLDNKNCILIPNQEREQCEAMTWHVTNLISVLESCSKHLCSPKGCVALGTEDKNEIEFLENSNGIFLPPSNKESAAGCKIEWSEELADALADRFDGVALLSEAFSAGNEANRYREFARFMELAFGLPFYDKQLMKKLTQFLESGPYGYTRNEINKWADLRHPTMHADLKEMDWIALSIDLRHVVLRMHQACLDILFNKEKWRDHSRSRRSIWKPEAISTSETGDVVVQLGAKLGLLFRIFDPFGIHPVDINVSVDHSKDNLYAKFVQSEHQIKFSAAKEEESTTI